MSGICWINGTDISTLGLELVSGTEGWSDGIEFEREAIAVPGRVGYEVSNVEISRPRQIVLRGHVSPSSVATRASSLDMILYRLRGQLTLKFGDSTSRVVYGYLSRVTTAEFAGGMAVAKLILTVTITCYDPSKWDATATTISFGTAGTEVPLGTLPSMGTVRINGPATNPVLSYHDTSTGAATQGSMTFTATLTTGEYLSVDLNKRTILEYATSGTSTNAMSALTTGDFFDIDPVHADLATGSWPTIKVTSGSGVLTVKRRWMT